jgi:hypothetical protein
MVAGGVASPLRLGQPEGHERDVREVAIGDLGEALLAEQLPLALEVRADRVGTIEQACRARLILSTPLEIRGYDSVERFDILLEEGAAKGPEQLLPLGQRRTRE